MPEPEAPLVTVIQAALLVAVHEQPVVADTETVPVVAPAARDRVLGVMLAVHCVVKMNWFDGVLAPDPDGPTAATRASYRMPGTGQLVRTLAKFTRIFPSGSGDGLPRPLVWKGWLAPIMKNCRS